METVTYQLPILPSSVIYTLLYFDIFQYPLSTAEVYKFCRSAEVTPIAVSELLAELVASGRVYCYDDFYMVSNRPDWVARRQQGNKRAANALPIAQKMSRIIASFPFVRGVMLSGSISKNYMEENSDIDYFVVTEAGRLWVARTILKLFRMFFLFNSSKQFCINYFVTKDQLTIEEQNIFTATEIVTLIPTYGETLYRDMQTTNYWTSEYYPNNKTTVDIALISPLCERCKLLLERCLKGNIGNRLDDYLLRKTEAYWQKKFAHMPDDDRKIAFKSTKQVSKQHANFYQKKVLQKLIQAQQVYENEHRLRLTL